MVSVDLCATPDFAAAIIVDENINVSYSNQCGGTMCAHPSVKGFLVPIGGAGPEIDPMLDRWSECPDYDDQEPYDPELVRRFIGSVSGWDQWFVPLDGWSGPWGEAWVPVKIIGGDWSPFEGFSGRTAIITYPNSD